ncbi:MAG: acyl-CoA reductase [Flavobacteriaceae bacterium]
MEPPKKQKEILSVCATILDRMGNAPTPEDVAIMEEAHRKNPWFTQDNVQHASRKWAEALNPADIDRWLQKFPETSAPKKVALILAGNIPWVGLHDVLAVLVSGHQLLIKCASDDATLIPYLLGQFPVSIQQTIGFTADRISDFDAVIATGSNNSARYFEAYFKDYPHIIRKNRNAVAVLDGNETAEQMEALGRDLLSYFGKGCRNVTHIYLPQSFDLNMIFGGVYPLADIVNHHSYANNYDYYRALYLMNDIPFLENGFFLLKEDTAISSPLATAHYSFYESLEDLEKGLQQHKDLIQCVVGQPIKNLPSFPLGEAQSPKLWDYADGVDTLAFLSRL